MAPFEVIDPSPHTREWRVRDFLEADRDPWSHDSFVGEHVPFRPSMRWDDSFRYPCHSWGHDSLDRDRDTLGRDSLASEHVL